MKKYAIITLLMLLCMCALSGCDEYPLEIKVTDGDLSNSSIDMLVKSDSGYFESIRSFENYCKKKEKISDDTVVIYFKGDMNNNGKERFYEFCEQYKTFKLRFYDYGIGENQTTEEYKLTTKKKVYIDEIEYNISTNTASLKYIYVRSQFVESLDDYDSRHKEVFRRTL